MSIADFISRNRVLSTEELVMTYALGPFNNFTRTNTSIIRTTTVTSQEAFRLPQKDILWQLQDTDGATVKYTGAIATTHQSI